MQPRSRFAFANGTLQVGPGNPLQRADVYLQEAARFNLVDQSTRLGNLAGTGTVAMAGGTLTIKGGAGSDHTFSGALTGFGTFSSSLSEGMVLSGNSPFSGILAARGGTLNISGTLPNVTGLSLTDGWITLDYTKAVGAESRVAQVPVDVSSGVLTLLVQPSANSAASLGSLTADGLARIVISNVSTSTPSTEGLLTFESIHRRDRGAFLFMPDLIAGRTARFDSVADLTDSLIGDPAIATARPLLPYANVQTTAGHLRAGHWLPRVGRLRASLNDHRRTKCASCNQPDLCWDGGDQFA